MNALKTKTHKEQPRAQKKKTQHYLRFTRSVWSKSRSRSRSRSVVRR